MKSETMPELLEELRQSAGCSYISDLHALASSQSVIDAAEKICDDKYDARAWNDVIRYITRENAVFDTAADAKRFLISRLAETES